MTSILDDMDLGDLDSDGGVDLPGPAEPVRERPIPTMWDPPWLQARFALYRTVKYDEAHPLHAQYCVALADVARARKQLYPRDCRYRGPIALAECIADYVDTDTSGPDCSGK